MSASRAAASAYMHWAKTSQLARYTLATSGVLSLSLEELGARWEDLALETHDRYGWEPLRAAIGALYGVGPERVVTAAGTSGANHLAISGLVAAGDEVVVESPSYEPLVALLEHLGAAVRFVERHSENGFALDPDDVRAAVTGATRLVVLTNLHNPSSAPIGKAELTALGALAAKVGARVLVDEVYLDAAFDDPPPSVAGLGEVFVATSSLTKVYGLGGLRGGWIVAEPALVDRLWRLKSLHGVDDPHVAERLALVALRERPRLLARSRALLEPNRATWNEFLSQRPADLEARPSRGGTTVFPKVLRGSGDALEALLRERYETTVVPGRFFGAPGHVRVGLTRDAAEFREGLSRLGRALDDLRSASCSPSP
jgi:aspartate/methionine/tyrosine aminotransferase